MAHSTLTPEVIDILRTARVSGNEIVLNCGRLSASLYKAVDKALTNAGGKWHRYKAAHVFTSDPAPKLQAMLSKGVSVDEKKELQAFYTPLDLAREIALIANVRGKRVLEPSAGDGKLAYACLMAGARSVDCVEINEGCRQALIASPLNHVTIADFLSLHLWKKYERIVMNPPFTKSQDVLHVQHALTFLAPRGILVAIMYPDQRRPKFQTLLKGLAYQISELPKGTFRLSGTMVSALVLKVTGTPSPTERRKRP